jgi:hypothetical protein
VNRIGKSGNRPGYCHVLRDILAGDGREKGMAAKNSLWFFGKFLWEGLPDFSENLKV